MPVIVRILILTLILSTYIHYIHIPIHSYYLHSCTYHIVILSIHVLPYTLIVRYIIISKIITTVTHLMGMASP